MMKRQNNDDCDSCSVGSGTAGVTFISANGRSRDREGIFCFKFAKPVQPLSLKSSTAATPKSGGELASPLEAWGVGADVSGLDLCRQVTVIRYSAVLAGLIKSPPIMRQNFLLIARPRPVPPFPLRRISLREASSLLIAPQSCQCRCLIGM
jgi:hypothetical protein